MREHKVYDYITNKYYSYPLFLTEDGKIVSAGFHLYDGPAYRGKFQYVSIDGGKKFQLQEYQFETHNLKML